jgi:hypothetical protein
VVFADLEIGVELPVYKCQNITLLSVPAGS